MLKGKKQALISKQIKVVMKIKLLKPCFLGDLVLVSGHVFRIVQQ